MYNKCKNTKFDAETWADLAGFEKLYKLQQTLKAKGANYLLFNSDDLYLCVQKIFEFLDLQLKSEYLEWKACATEDQLIHKSEDWKETKKLPLFLHWHGEALQSNGLIQRIRVKPKVLFETITNKDDRDILLLAYKKCDVYYQLLKKEN